MKSKISLLIILIFFSSKVFADGIIKFDTVNLQILENGNLIKAGKGKAFTENNEIEIFGDKFEFNKNMGILIVNQKGYANLRKHNVKISFDKATFNQFQQTILTEGNVVIEDKKRKYEIKTEKAIYNKKDDIFESDVQSILTDRLGNIFISQEFILNIKNNILKTKELEFKDVENNNFQTPIAFVNLNSGKFFGKNVSLDLISNISDEKNDPRLRSRSLINDENFTEIKKGTFTICKKREGCPPWQISSNRILHDKKKKTIYYDDAVLRVYDVPVMYFPKFFHPDPSVKRQSGFLSPTFQSSSNTGDYLNTPYFLAIAENKDATFSPRFFDNEKILLQTEYRELNKFSEHFMDLSFLSNKNENSKNHFFYNYQNNKKRFNNFLNNLFSLKIQKVSGDNYLEKNKIESDIISNRNILENSLNFDLNSEDLSLNINSSVFENLDKNDNDRYEYILPRIDIAKKLQNKTSLDGEFIVNSDNYFRNYETNIYESVNINELYFNSDEFYTKNGFSNNYKFIIKNVNSNTQKSSSFKEGEDFYLSSIIQYNSSLPLLKENETFRKILNPKIAINVAPNNTKNNKSSQNKIDISNVYEINRASLNNSVEGGISLTYGGDYSISRLEDTREIFKLRAANNLRIEENNDLPERNQINDKTSNFFGELFYDPNQYFNFKYSTSVKNNLKEINEENFLAELKRNKFTISFDYLNSNYKIDSSSYLTSKLTYKINTDNNLIFSTRENKSTDLTEYYNLMYQYINDCLSASIEYNKDYYSDRDLKPEESLMFKIRIIPINETSSPNFLE